MVGGQSAAFDLSNANQFVALTGAEPDGTLRPGASFNTNLLAAESKNSTRNLAPLSTSSAAQNHNIGLVVNKDD